MKRRKSKKRRELSLHKKLHRIFARDTAAIQRLQQENAELVHTAFPAVVDRDIVRKQIEEMEKAQGRAFFENKAKR